MGDTSVFGGAGHLGSPRARRRTGEAHAGIPDAIYGGWRLPRHHGLRLFGARQNGSKRQIFGVNEQISGGGGIDYLV
jgi:hypothetical protein